MIYALPKPGQATGVTATVNGGDVGEGHLDGALRTAVP